MKRLRTELSTTQFMNNTTPPTLIALSSESRIIEVSPSTPPGAPLIKSCLWKLAKNETRTQDIETLLLLIFGILGLLTVAYGIERIFSFVANN
jgi:hypothetical protein